MRYNSDLTTASGQKIIARGIAKVRLKIGTYETYHEVVVLDDLKTDFIIGVDLMEKHNFVIDIGNKKIQQTTRKREVTEFSIQSPRNLHLESCEVATIKVRPPLSMRNAEPGTNFLVSGEWVPEGICTINKDLTADIIIANKTILPVQIFRGEPIGNFERVGGTLTVNELVSHGAVPSGAVREAPVGAMHDLHAQPVNGDASSAESDVNRRITKNGEGIKARIIPQEMIDKACDTVPSQYKRKFGDLLQQYSDIFAINSDEVGKCGVIKSRIDLKNPDQVVARPPYRIPHHLSAVVDMYISKLLKQGVITKSTSEFSSPLMLVKKPGGLDKNKPLIEQWRIVQDYRMLNLNTTGMVYPINHIHDLLTKVSQGSYFSVLDLASGFWNQELEESHRKYTAFAVAGVGLFEFTRTPQGCKNSGPYFQKLLDFLISGIGSTYVYIDDVICVSRDLDEQLKTLQQVFERFRKYGLKCRISKVKLCARTVNYLGFEINGTSGIRPAELKTQAIRDFPEPSNVTQVKSWLGMTSYYRRVIRSYSEIARPMTLLTRKDSGYISGKLPPEAAESFRILKEKLSTRPCIKPIQFDRPYIVTIDSSALNTGIILSQIGNDGVEHPCLYASKTHSEPESRRSALKIESDGIVYGMRILAPIIRAGHCIIRTDHRPLLSLDKTSTPILDRIHAELEEYSYEMQHIKGKTMPSDALSRIPPPNHENCHLCSKNQSEINIISSTVTPKENATTSFKRHEVSMLELRAEYESKQPLVSGLSQQQIIQLQREDHLCKAIFCWLRYGALPNAHDLRQAVLQYGKFARIENGMLGMLDNNKFRIFAPYSIRETLLHLSHDFELAGHLGIKKTLDRLTAWFWPTISDDVTSHVKRCVKCNQNNPPNAYTRMPLRTLPQTIRMGQRLHLDLIGPYSHSGKDNYKYALVMCDSYTSYIKVVPLVSKHASEVAKAFVKNWIVELGIPEACTTDQGSEYTAKLFRELCKILKIELKYINVNHAQANSQIERQNRNILTYIRKYIEENDQDWSEMLPHISFAMNTSVHTDKRRSPWEMLYARKPITVTNYIGNRYSEDDLEQLLNRHFKIVQQVKEDRKAAFLSHKKQFDKRANSKSYVPGDCIYIGHMQKAGMHRKMQNIFDGPFLVTKNLSFDTIEAEHMVTGKKIVAHKNRTKPASAPQQIYREAGKVDLNLPSSNEQREAYGSHPANENGGGLVNEGAIKSYGYSSGVDSDVPAGAEKPDDYVSDASDLENSPTPHTDSQEDAPQRIRRPPPPYLVTSPRGEQTKSYFGPMTRARFKSSTEWNRMNELKLMMIQISRN